MQDFDYADLVNDRVLGFTPSPVFQPPVQQPQGSGYSTPNRGARGGRGGRGSFPRGGGNVLGGSAPSSGRASPNVPAPYPNRGGFGGGRGRGAGLGASFGGADRGAFGMRGGMRGGPRGGAAYSGSSTPRSVVGMGNGAFNPLLVPVKFVRASAEGLGTVGGEDEHGLELAGAASPPRPAARRVPRHSVEGVLADEVKNLVLEADEQDMASGPPPPETAFEPEPATTATMALDELEDAPDAAEPVSHPGLGSRARHPVEREVPAPLASPAASAPPVDADEAVEDDAPPLFEISVTRSTVTVDLSALPPPTAFSRKSDHSSTPTTSASDSDSDAEQILFPRRAHAQADPVLSLRTPLAPATAAPATELALPTPAAAAPAEARTRTHPSQPAQPARQSKKALKRAARNARKLGREHARSGNAHATGPGRRLGGDNVDDEEAAADRAAGAEMFARLQGTGVGVDDMLSGSDETSADDVDAEGHVPGAPRLGDSDLEWGGEAPPPRARVRGRAKKAAQRAARAETRETEKLERLVRAGGAREEVQLALALELSVREERRASRARERRAAEEDYAANVADEGDDSMAVLAAFAGGAVGTLGGEHGRGDDADRRMAEAEDDSDEWGTSSEGADDDDSADEEDTEGANDRRLALEEEDESDDVDSDDELEVEYSLGDADGRVEHSLSLASSDSGAESFDSSLSSSTDSDVELFAFESALLAGQKVSISRMGQGGSGGRKDERERKKARRSERKGKARAAEADSDEDSSEDDDDAILFTGKDTWADRDEDYISQVQAAVRLNADLLCTAQGGRAGRRSNRRERNKLFKAISEGNFDDVDLYDEALDLDDELVEAMFAEQEEAMAFVGGPSKKQRKKDKTFSGAFSAQLAEQWDLDRSKKASRKAQRAAERAASRDAEFRDSYRDKHQSRGKAGAKMLTLNGAQNDAAAINTRIRHFIATDLSATSLSLPPMAKKARIAVHLLAEVYGLKSRSLGSGKARFPVLERTSRTTVVGVSERRVRAIVGTADGEHELDSDWGGPRGKGKYRGKMGGLWKALEGASGQKSGGGRGQLGKNAEGAVVGQGADRIGEDNVGFALLKKMGWTEGGQIGLSGQGLHEPVVARMKSGKSGLGSGFAASRSEAYALARGPE
ncbi:hypothetical protein JCM3770_006646 [Rhodotorula araucariae]